MDRTTWVGWRVDLCDGLQLVRVGVTMRDRKLWLTNSVRLHLEPWAIFAVVALATFAVFRCVNAP